jgi:putative acetyltransferase
LEEGEWVYNAPVPKIIIRALKLTDTPALLEFVNAIAKEEKVMVSCQGQTFTLQQEEELVQKKIKLMGQGRVVNLVAVAGEKIVGIASVEQELSNPIKRHLAAFGIMISAGVRGEGLGERLARAVINEAKDQIKGLQIIILTVFGRNEIAQRLYRKLGFRRFGQLPNGVINCDDTTEEELFMYLPMDRWG